MEKLKSEMLLVCAIVVLMGAASAWGVVIGPSAQPAWEPNAQVKLGWVFDDPQIPENTPPLAGWDQYIGSSPPTWDYNSVRELFGVPAQWYIRIPNLDKDNPLKRFWLSVVYERDPLSQQDPRVHTNIDWFPFEDYQNYVVSQEEWFDASGNPTTIPDFAVYGRMLITVDMYPNPQYEDIWVGLPPGLNLREAYVITWCVEVEVDYGDAPDPNYPTLFANDGARHLIGGPYFCDAAGGDAPDPEPDGQPDQWALGDDNDGGADEDGVSFPVLAQGQPGIVALNVCGGGGIVEVWVDYNGDEDWDDAGELEFSGWMGDGPNTIVVNPPPDSAIGTTFARCRISTAGIGLPTGRASDGEVEDHMVQVRPAPICWDNVNECEGQDEGDSNCDGDVNFLDLGRLKVSFFSNYGDPHYDCCSDYNHDCAVNFLDLGILKVNFFETGHTPSTGAQGCPATCP